MRQKIHPAVAVVIAIAVIAVIGLVSTKFIGVGEPAKPIVVPAPDRNDPHFKADPKLSGGGGG